MAGEGEAAMSVPAEGEEQGSPPPAWEQALAVCLGRGSADVRAVCMLLATAKRLRALVHEHCRPGSLVVCFRLRTLARGHGFAAWLSQHGALLGDLEVDLGMIGREQEAPGEQLQHPADAILEQLPGSVTTRLVVHSFGSDTSAAKSARGASLAEALAVQPMQQLRELQLLDIFVGAAYDQVVRSALAGSSQLTSVVVSLINNRTAAALMHCWSAPPLAGQLAAQLQQLVVDSRACVCGTYAPVAVAHLTRLTRLVMPAALDSGSGGVPSSVVSLGVFASADAAPQLLALTQLTQLQLKVAAHLPAEQLRSLSGLRQLQHLELEATEYNSEALFVAVAASSFTALPLRRLDAKGIAAQELSAASLADVGRCTGLTRLALQSYTLAEDACMEQLAAALAQLTALRRLELMQVPFGAVAIINRGAAEALARAIGSLQQLTDCFLSGHALGPAGAHLGGATALTSLWPGDDLDDGTLAAICVRATQLQYLNLIGSPQLTDTSLVVIAAMQRQLTQLLLGRCSRRGITAAGLARLTAALLRLDFADL